MRPANNTRPSVKRFRPPQTSIPKPSTAPVLDWLLTLAKLGGAATAISVLVGWLYQQGKMDGMQLPAGLFPVKVEDLLLSSYPAVLTLALQMWGWAMAHKLWAILVGLAYRALPLDPRQVERRPVNAKNLGGSQRLLAAHGPSSQRPKNTRNLALALTNNFGLFHGAPRNQDALVFCPASCWHK